MSCRRHRPEWETCDAKNRSPAHHRRPAGRRRGLLVGQRLLLVGGGAFDAKNCQGGTLYILNQSDPTAHHLDPARIYTSGGGAVPSLIFRTLTTRHRVPGEAGDQVVPDLATDTGKPSDDAKTWTYHLKDGLKFDDGTPITAKDIKWGVERSFAPELPGGIPYLRDWLVGGEDYKGPYKGKELDSIQTPDDKTIVFKLRKPEGDFPYVATATQFAPVPKAKDDGTGYEKHPVASGPYKVQSHEQDKSMVLVRNPYWSRAVDDQRLACPDRIEGTYGLNAAVINQRLSSSAARTRTPSPPTPTCPPPSWPGSLTTRT